MSPETEQYLTAIGYPQEISERYARRRDSPREVLERPLWFQDFTKAVWAIKERETSGDYDICAQLSDRMQVVSRFLVLSSPRDVTALEVIKQSLTHFAFSGYDGQMDEGKTEKARVFAWEITELMDAGLESHYIAEWFKIVGNIAFVDPSFSPLLSPATVFNTIEPLAGMYKDAGLQAERVRELRYAIPSDISPFYSLSAFLGKTAIALKEIIDLYPEEPSEKEKRERNDLWEIYQAVFSTTVFLQEVKAMGFPGLEITRPTPHNQITPLIAGALSEWFIKKHVGEFIQITSSETERLADDLLNIYQRRRVLPSEKEIIGFCADFLKPTDQGIQAGHDFGKGLQMLTAFSSAFWDYGLENRRKTLTPMNKEEWQRYQKQYIENMMRIYDDGIKKIIPAFLRRIHEIGMVKEPLSEEAYAQLGLGKEVWIDHRRKRLEAERYRVPGIEAIGRRSAVVLVTGEFFPLTTAHCQNAAWITQMPAKELRNMGLQIEGDDIWVAIGLNSGNPAKARLEQQITIEDRADWAEKAFTGIRNVVFWRKPHDIYGCSEERLQHHLQVLQGRGINEHQVVRMAGTDHLDPTSWTYTENTEPGGFAELNRRPTIFLLQAEDLTSLSRLVEVVEGIKRTHSNSLIVVPNNPEVHSSYIRTLVANEEPSEAILTLLHPRIARQVVDKLQAAFGYDGK